MTLNFYPHSDDAQKGSFEERIDVLMDAAERYKVIVLDAAAKAESTPETAGATKYFIPRDQSVAFNWEEIALILREIREMPEASKTDKTRKGNLLAKLSEVYEVLRAAKMTKLEAVRIALMNEANQLRGPM
jgi:hypothetical protein